MPNTYARLDSVLAFLADGDEFIDRTFPTATAGLRAEFGALVLALLAECPPGAA